jgi:predicted nucleotidyltransferase
MAGRLLFGLAILEEDDADSDIGVLAEELANLSEPFVLVLGDLVDPLQQSLGLGVDPAEVVTLNDSWRR